VSVFAGHFGVETVLKRLLTLLGLLLPLSLSHPAAAQYLEAEELRVGTGIEAKAGNHVAVHYTGWLTNGRQFDSSKSRGEPFTFLLGGGQVIKGWDQGVVGMREGGVRRLTIPPELGYGARGAGPIPPGSTLIFEVELLKVRR
jgi:FKBP-type peptidyl-prolyl cis-trans isomerase